MVEHTDEDVGNITLLEHVNVQVPAQTVAALFYITGLGLTRDPYLNVGLQNMWVNIGEQQFHLPTRPAQVIDGVIGLVMPEIDSVRERLISLEEPLKETKFSWSASGEELEVTGPWGNRFRCHRAGGFGDMQLGIPYVEFRVPQRAAGSIARFYETVFDAPAVVRWDTNGSIAEVKVGRNQHLCFREVQEQIAPYEGHHVAVYVAKFSPAFDFLKSRSLISEDVHNHQFRFKEISDLDSGTAVYHLEHEVRSLYHPMFGRRFINRDPQQSQRNYRRGRDSLIGSIH